PILLLKLRLDEMSKDNALELISAGGVMKRDIITFCEAKGYIIENITEQYGKVHFKIRKFL
ncbi:MAG TPA: sulfurtransferase TusA family protein, partial [Thermodesulfobium narugense]|nr:sulfurtransferase TusA family protein [Thermodesulfobium narugense]